AEVAEKQGCAATDEIALHIATLRLARENLTARLIAGATINPDHLLRLDEAIKPYLPAAKPTQVKIHIVEGVQGRYECLHCHRENILDPAGYDPGVKENPAPATPAPGGPPQATETHKSAEVAAMAQIRRPTSWPSAATTAWPPSSTPCRPP